jgi:nucleoside-diphosphate-sugar epimerase
LTKLLFGCGYLGRRVATAWHAAGDVVHVVTRSTARAAEFRAQGWTAHIADICEPASLAALPAVDTVLFCVGFDRSSGREQRAVMVDGLSHVLDHCRGRCERFVYTSSSSVYGQCAGEWVDEDSPCEPTQPGGQCCLAAEQLVWQALPGGSAVPSATVLRLAGLYGPGRLLSRVESLQRGEPLAGNAEAWLNLIHVDDAVAAVLACEHRWQPGATHLVCDDRPVTRGEYYAALARHVGAPTPTFDDAQPARRGSGGLNKRCRSDRVHARLEIAWRYPSYVEGLVSAVG